MIDVTAKRIADHENFLDTFSLVDMDELAPPVVPLPTRMWKGGGSHRSDLSHLHSFQRKPPQQINDPGKMAEHSTVPTVWW